MRPYIESRTPQIANGHCALFFLSRIKLSESKKKKKKKKRRWMIETLKKAFTRFGEYLFTKNLMCNFINFL